MVDFYLSGYPWAFANDCKSFIRSSWLPRNSVKGGAVSLGIANPSSMVSVSEIESAALATFDIEIDMVEFGKLQECCEDKNLENVSCDAYS